MLKAFAENQPMMEAVKAKVLAKFDELISSLELTKDNQSLGELVRARLEGRRKVEEAFKEISLLAKLQDNKPPVNPAR